METDAATIAASLTEAQREALLRAEADGHLGKLFVRWWHANGRTLRSLTRRHLSSVVWSGVVLTPLGEAVRRELEGGSHAQY
jgi:hypothetical protein